MNNPSSGHPPVMCFSRWTPAKLVMLVIVSCGGSKRSTRSFASDAGDAGDVGCDAAVHRSTFEGASRLWKLRNVVMSSLTYRCSEAPESKPRTLQPVSSAHQKVRQDIWVGRTFSHSAADRASLTAEHVLVPEMQVRQPSLPGQSALCSQNNLEKETMTHFTPHFDLSCGASFTKTGFLPRRRQCVAWRRFHVCTVYSHAILAGRGRASHHVEASRLFGPLCQLQSSGLQIIDRAWQH